MRVMIQNSDFDTMWLEGSQESPQAKGPPKAIIWVGLAVIFYGITAGIFAATLLDIAPFSADPEGYESVGQSLLFPLGSTVDFFGGILRAAVATAAGNGAGLVAGWILFALLGIAIALAQAFCAAAFALGAVRLARLARR